MHEHKHEDFCNCRSPRPGPLYWSTRCLECDGWLPRLTTAEQMQQIRDRGAELGREVWKALREDWPLLIVLYIALVALCALIGAIV